MDEAEWFIVITRAFFGPIWAYSGAAFYDSWSISPGDSFVERLLHAACFWPIVTGLHVRQNFANFDGYVFPLVIGCGLATSLAIGCCAIVHLRRVA